MKRFPLVCLMIFVIYSWIFAGIRILHTNDSHAAYEPSREGIGGYLALEYHLQQSRTEAEQHLWLDAGDILTGTIFSSMEYEGLQGGAVLEVFGRLGLDAATLGNHEFDISNAHARALVERADFPFYSANILDQDGSSFGRSRYGIFERGDLNIGVIGLTIHSLPERVKAENVQDLTILSYVDALEEILPEVDAATDLIILLTHNGWEEDVALAEALDDRVDLIIGGHSHVATLEPFAVNGKYIFSAGSHLQYLGVIDIEVEEDRITDVQSQLIPLTSPPPEYESPLAVFLQESISELESQLARIAGVLPYDFEVDKFNPTKGSKWVAGALLAAYPKADLAMINNGGLRKHLPAGPVSLRDLHEYIPFGNTVALFSCTGQDIITAQARNLQIASYRPYDILTVSSPDWMQDSPGFRIGGEQIQPDKRYRIVTHDYIVSQWDKYLGFQPQDLDETGELFLDVIIRQVELDFGAEQ